MATIRRRKTSWQAQIRRKGYPPLSKTFTYKADAIEWARSMERDIDRGEIGTNKKLLSNTNLGELLRRYEQEVTPTKKSASSEIYRLRAFHRHPISRLSLDRIKPHEIARYRDDRLKVVQSGSVRRELSILQHCLETARVDWGFPFLSNPAAIVKAPPPSKARERRLKPGELDQLLDGCKQMRVDYLERAIILAVETAMRRGELVALRWSDIDLHKKTARLRDTKNGHPRTVPLSESCIALLSPINGQGEGPIPASANALRLAWEGLRRRVDINDLRFHDLRHEAVSRLFEQGLPLHQIAYISGHRDIRMLMRYAHWGA